MSCENIAGLIDIVVVCRVDARFVALGVTSLGVIILLELDMRIFSGELLFEVRKLPFFTNLPGMVGRS